MASSRDTRNGPDWQDVAQAIINYEGFWNARVELVITAEGNTKRGDLYVVARAIRGLSDEPVPTILASVSVNARSANYNLLESVVLKALYQLDIAVYQENPSMVD